MGQTVQPAPEPEDIMPDTQDPEFDRQVENYTNYLSAKIEHEMFLGVTDDDDV